MNYLDFVEEYLNHRGLNQFEKIQILASRAKDIYDGKATLVDGMKKRKPTAKAQIEIKKGLITPNILEEDPNKSEAEDLDLSEMED